MRFSGGQEGVPKPRNCRAEGPVTHGAEVGLGGWKGVYCWNRGGWGIEGARSWMHWWVGRETLFSVLNGTRSQFRDLRMGGDMIVFTHPDQVSGNVGDGLNLLWQDDDSVESSIHSLDWLKSAGSVRIWWGGFGRRFKVTVRLWFSFAGGFCKLWMSFFYHLHYSWPALDMLGQGHSWLKLHYNLLLNYYLKYSSSCSPNRILLYYILIQSLP